jgi:hypothetical protein
MYVGLDLGPSGAVPLPQVIEKDVRVGVVRRASEHIRLARGGAEGHGVRHARRRPFSQCWRAVGEGRRNWIQLPDLPVPRNLGLAPHQIEAASRGVGDERGVHARRRQVGFTAGEALAPRACARIPFPDVSQAAGTVDVPAAHQHDHARSRVVGHGVAETRAWFVPRDRALGPGLRRRIPFPCVLLGNALKANLRLLHAAEQDRAAACAVPNQRTAVAGTGRGFGLNLGPLAGCGIPLPGVAQPGGDVVSKIDFSIDAEVCCTSEEQHLAGGLFEHHAVLAAGNRPLARAGGHGPACGIPLPKLG